MEEKLLAAYECMCCDFTPDTTTLRKSKKIRKVTDARERIFDVDEKNEAKSSSKPNSAVPLRRASTFAPAVKIKRARAREEREPHSGQRIMEPDGFSHYLGSTGHARKFDLWLGARTTPFFVVDVGIVGFLDVEMSSLSPFLRKVHCEHEYKLMSNLQRSE
jgi:hypothetical protein